MSIGAGSTAGTATAAMLGTGGQQPTAGTHPAVPASPRRAWQCCYSTQLTDPRETFSSIKKEGNEIKYITTSGYQI